ncbi:MAG: hypothetical protein HN904_11845 [Victivallales bacterium]|nr:hypothetical protein [Victivallales bacterium]MBT7163466.1 hypothetical protein [Victivallales bacterium]
MGAYGQIMAPVADHPDRIAACSQRDKDGEPACEMEHEVSRTLVGTLPAGTRIAFCRPGGEGRRTGRIVSQPAEFCYRVAADDGKGDHHLDTGLVAVLWASHDVAVLGKTKIETKPEPETEGKSMTKHTTGPNRTDDHWREFVGRVIDLVDNHGRLLKEALAEANKELGCKHTPTSYRSAAKRLAMAATTTRGELVSRARRRPKKGKGSGRSGPSGDSGPSGAGAAGTEDAELVLGAPRGEDIAKLARQIVAGVESEIQGGSVALPEDLVADLAKGMPMDAELRRRVERHACHLMAAYMRGRESRPADVGVLPPTGTEPDGPVYMISQTIGLLMGRAKPYLDAVATLQQTRTELLEAGE